MKAMFAVSAAALLAACSTLPPQPYGSPFPLNPQVQAQSAPQPQPEPQPQEVVINE